MPKSDANPASELIPASLATSFIVVCSEWGWTLHVPAHHQLCLSLPAAAASVLAHGVHVQVSIRTHLPACMQYVEMCVFVWVSEWVNMSNEGRQREIIWFCAREWIW